MCTLNLLLPWVNIDKQLPAPVQTHPNPKSTVTLPPNLKSICPLSIPITHHWCTSSLTGQMHFHIQFLHHYMIRVILTSIFSTLFLIALSDTSVGSEESSQDRSRQQAWQVARSIYCLGGSMGAWCFGERGAGQRHWCWAKVRPMVPLH